MNRKIGATLKFKTNRKYSIYEGFSLLICFAVYAKGVSTFKKASILIKLCFIGRSNELGQKVKLKRKEQGIDDRATPHIRNNFC